MNEDTLYHLWKTTGIAYVKVKIYANGYDDEDGCKTRIRPVEFRKDKPYVIWNRGRKGRIVYLHPGGYGRQYGWEICRNGVYYDACEWTCHYPERPLWYPWKNPFPTSRSLLRRGAVAAVPVVGLGAIAEVAPIVQNMQYFAQNGQWVAAGANGAHNQANPIANMAEVAAMQRPEWNQMNPNQRVNIATRIITDNNWVSRVLGRRRP